MKSHVPKTLVLCEGKDDQMVMEALAKHSGIEDKLSFQQYDGKDKLREYLNYLKSSPEFTRGEYSHILVTRDADSSHSNAWDALKGAVRDEFGMEFGSPGQSLRIADGPEISAWVIPGPGQTGMIETLCMESARSNSPEVFGCLDSFSECLRGVHGHPLHEKARFHIWTIAAQGAGAQDRMSLKYALSNLSIDWNDKVFDSLRELLAGVAKYYA